MTEGTTVTGVRIVAVMTDETRKKGVETIGIGIEIARGAAVTRGTTIVAVQGKTIVEIVDEKNEMTTMNHHETGSAVRRAAVAKGGAARIVKVGPILNLQQLLGLHLIFVFASFPKSSQKDDSTSRRASSSMFFPGVLTEQSKWQTAKSSIASLIDIWRPPSQRLGVMPLSLLRQGIGSIGMPRVDCWSATPRRAVASFSCLRI
mmetsp:Transcript_26111/g.52934  ORF Transcript_26111/g.52934 Transcript_26111/m.52934 type:complete len:204 (+) Transcript_26111:1385-1996(+)